MCLRDTRAGQHTTRCCVVSLHWAGVQPDWTRVQRYVMRPWCTQWKGTYNKLGEKFVLSVSQFPEVSDTSLRSCRDICKWAQIWKKKDILCSLGLLGFLKKKNHNVWWHFPFHTVSLKGNTSFWYQDYLTQISVYGYKKNMWRPWPGPCDHAFIIYYFTICASQWKAELLPGMHFGCLATGATVWLQKNTASNLKRQKHKWKTLRLKRALNYFRLSPHGVLLTVDPLWISPPWKINHCFHR